VQTTAAARPTAPLAIPADIRALLARFDLTLDGLLTDSNPKLIKGRATAHSVILHHLPARALAAAVTPGHQGATAPRSYLAKLAAIGDREGLGPVALRHNGCPWATAGCMAGCLAWAGHGGLSASVAAARGRRTLAMLASPATYGRALLWAIARHWAKAQALEVPLAVRLRGTDEGPAIGWHRLALELTPSEAQALSRRFGLIVEPSSGPDHTLASILGPALNDGSLWLYDYSKAPLSGPLGLKAQSAAGWHVTASMAADRDTAVADAWLAARAGYSIAIPTALAKGQPLPVAVTLTPYGGESLTLPAVDGDATDQRWKDPAGSAVILRTKTSRGAGSAAGAFSLAPTAEDQPLRDGLVRLSW